MNITRSPTILIIIVGVGLTVFFALRHFAPPNSREEILPKLPNAEQHVTISSSSSKKNRGSSIEITPKSKNPDQITLEEALAKITDLSKMDDVVKRKQFLRELDQATMLLPPDEQYLIAQKLSEYVSDKEYSFVGKIFQQIVILGRLDIAEKWLTEMADDPTNNSRIQTLAARLANTNSSGFLTAAQALSGKSLLDLVKFAGVNSISKSSLDQGLEVTNSIPPTSSYRNRAEAAALLGASEGGVDPNRLFNSIKDDPRWINKNDLLVTMGRIWAGTSPVNAVNAGNQLADDGQRQSYFKGVSDAWSQQNPAEASKWVASIPNGIVRDGCIEAMVGNIMLQDPDSAVKWSLSVSDPLKRDKLVNDVFLNWSKNDPQAASIAKQNLNKTK